MAAEVEDVGRVEGENDEPSECQAIGRVDAPAQDDRPADEHHHDGRPNRRRPEAGEQGVGDDDQRDGPRGPAPGDAEQAEQEPDEPGQQHEVLAGDHQHVDDPGAHKGVPLGAF